jgi:hypothetical protein
MKNLFSKFQQSKHILAPKPLQYLQLKPQQCKWTTPFEQECTPTMRMRWPPAGGPRWAPVSPSVRPNLGQSLRPEDHSRPTDFGRRKWPMRSADWVEETRLMGTLTSTAMRSGGAALFAFAFSRIRDSAFDSQIFKARITSSKCKLHKRTDVFSINKDAIAVGRCARRDLAQGHMRPLVDPRRPFGGPRGPRFVRRHSLLGRGTVAVGKRGAIWHTNITFDTFSSLSKAGSGSSRTWQRRPWPRNGPRFCSPGTLPGLG